MQRLAGDFLVKRVVTLYGPGGATTELYELPNGQWQFGKGRDAVVVTSLEQVAGLDAGTQKDVAAWLERTKGQALQAVQQGQTPLLAGETARDRLGRAIAMMSDEVVNRLLTAVEQTIGPVADSILQSTPVNHHSEGYGQDQAMAAPGDVTARPFTLPPGARYCDPGKPEAGYLVPDPEIRDERGQPTLRWHPTPAFESFVEQAADVKSDIEQEMAAEREKHADKELVGAGRAKTRRR